MPGEMTTDDLYALVQELTAGERTTGDQPAALDRLMPLVAEHRSALGQVRNRYAARLHGHSDDFEATAALTLLNRAMAEVPTTDRLDWKLRWAKGRKP